VPRRDSASPSSPLGAPRDTLVSSGEGVGTAAETPATREDVAEGGGVSGEEETALMTVEESLAMRRVARDQLRCHDFQELLRRGPESNRVETVSCSREGKCQGLLYQGGPEIFPSGEGLLVIATRVTAAAALAGEAAAEAASIDSQRTECGGESWCRKESARSGRERKVSRSSRECFACDNFRPAEGPG